MQLPGRLRLTTLGDVLGALHRAGASGVLELGEDRGVTHRIYVRHGMITQVDTDLHRQRLGELLARQGFVGARALARLARRLMEAPGQRAGEILVQEGFVSSELVSAGLRRQLRQKLDALFELKDAQLTFRVPRPHEGHRAPLSPGEFLHGRPRARTRAKSQTPPRTETSRATPAAPRAYALLGLRPGADRDAIQRAFRTLARSLHPDCHPHASSEERARLLTRFAELSAAYHALQRQSAC
jgi:DnaJ domain